jgi:two-component SAPR family response regulator
MLLTIVFIKNRLFRYHHKILFKFVSIDLKLIIPISCMRAISRFLIIDDDPSNNFLCEIMLKKTIAGMEIRTFLQPEIAVDFIKKEYSNGNAVPTILFLDINMPVMTGWDFLETLEAFDDKIIQHFTIYIVSSSVDQMDKKRAVENPLVIDYIEKPVTVEKLKKILS